MTFTSIPIRKGTKAKLRKAFDKMKKNKRLRVKTWDDFMKRLI